MTTIDPAKATRYPRAALRRRIAARTLATSTTMRELPDLDADVEREERPAERLVGQAELAQDVGESEAVDQAEDERHPGAQIAAVAAHQVVGADEHDAERNRRLDDGGRRRHQVRAPRATA